MSVLLTNRVGSILRGLEIPPRVNSMVSPNRGS